MQRRSFLLLDMVSEYGSVGLSHCGELRVRTMSSPRAQAASALPLIESLLKEADCDLKDLSYVACTIGPGSFTGIRLSIALTQGLAFGLGLPVLGLSIGELLGHWAYRQWGHAQSTLWIDARMQQWIRMQSFVQGLGEVTLQAPPILVSLAEQQDTLRMGEGPHILVAAENVEPGKEADRAFVWCSHEHPLMEDMAILSEKRFVQGHPSVHAQVLELYPLYVREVVA